MFWLLRVCYGHGQMVNVGETVFSWILEGNLKTDVSLDRQFHAFSHDVPLNPHSPFRFQDCDSPSKKSIGNLSCKICLKFVPLRRKFELSDHFCFQFQREQENKVDIRWSTFHSQIISMKEIWQKLFISLIIEIYFFRGLWRLPHFQ